MLYGGCTVNPVRQRLVFHVASCFSSTLAPTWGRRIPANSLQVVWRGRDGRPTPAGRERARRPGLTRPVCAPRRAHLHTVRCMRFARSVPCAIRSSTRHRRTTETKAAFKTTELMAYVAPSSQEGGDGRRGVCALGDYLGRTRGCLRGFRETTRGKSRPGCCCQAKGAAHLPSASAAPATRTRHSSGPRAAAKRSR
jgi:hypothetical protein